MSKQNFTILVIIRCGYGYLDGYCRGGERFHKAYCASFFNEMGYAVIHYERKLELLLDSMCGGWMMMPCGKRLVVWRAGEKALKGL